MRIDNQQQQNKGVMDLMPQTGAVEEKNGIQLFADAVKTESSKKATGTTSFQAKEVTYLNPAKEEKKTIIDEIEQSGSMDAGERKAQMAVLAETTSPEDYKKMQEEGFSLDDTTSNKIVTVTDKIKAQLAKAGVDISAFGDDLDFEQLAQITGSPELAAQIADSLREADLPLTDDNFKQIAETVDMADSLSSLDDGAVKYLIDNQLEPTVQNIYFARHSASAGYMPAEQQDISSFLPQVKNVIASAGLEVNDDTIATSKWMLENDIPLTKENLTYAQALRQTELTTSAENVAALAAEAVSEGKSAQDAVILSGYTWMEQAQNAVDTVENATDEDLVYIVEKGLPLTLDSLREAATNRVSGSTVQDADGNYTQKGQQLLTARRQLEEIRLAMTAEANYRLLKQGISIDTEPLVKLVEQLKDQENEYYRNLLMSEGVDATKEQVELFGEVDKKVTDMRYVPAYVLGMKDADVSTINGVHEAGTELKTSFEKASRQYETLMTAPRADLGDSIQKAFRNVDDILNDLGMELTDENRRAVRILGYNSIDITQDSVLTMKAADEEVQRVFKNMTPAVVTQMIKRGINPLEMDFTSLNQEAESIKSEELGGEDNRKFSEYLWKMEQNHEISEEERSSYIGIYRLIRQVENTDGAAIGALIQQGAPLTMKNLLTAVRSEKRSSKMDYSVDYNFEGVSGTSKGSSITDQIEAAYQNNCLKDASELLTPERAKVLFEQDMEWENMTPEELKAVLTQAGEQADESSIDADYAKEQLAQLEQAANADESIYRILDKYDIPNTVSNVLAMESMLNQRNQMFRKIFGSSTSDHNGDDQVDAEDLEAIKQELLEEFGEAVSEPADMAVAQEKLGELAENVMKTMINSDHVTSLDVRDMKMLSAQLSVNSILAKEEQYAVPVMVNDELMNVSVKIVRGVDKKGIVDIMMESELRGKIAATFQAKEDGIHGLIATDSEETAELFKGQTQDLSDLLGGENDDVTELHCAHIPDLDLNHFSMGAFGVDAKEETQLSDSQKAENRDTYRVQTSRLYGIAEHFIKAVKGTLTKEV
ncbi:DUF6240 domain-containing protein [Roseburia rectibacter]|jgi:hypothetical protein|uniref:DUF6240 domain-containing protein n=1 Tax=Roseburia TaxID=841 RepID=UPI00164C156C|nr:DUF6240 domain-containing protein [Roseburia rectibacter]UMZ00431.1 DUF6240 domain-containing protein [Roseburia rectibacter]